MSGATPGIVRANRSHFSANSILLIESGYEFFDHIIPRYAILVEQQHEGDAFVATCPDPQIMGVTQSKIRWAKDNSGMVDYLASDIDLLGIRWSVVNEENSAHLGSNSIK